MSSTILVLVLAVLPVPAVLIVLLCHSLDFRRCSLDQHRVATDVLAVHFLGCAEVVVGIGEAYEARLMYTPFRYFLYPSSATRLALDLS